MTENLEILRGEKRLLEQRDEKVRNDRDSAMKELSDVKAKFTASELDVKSKYSEIALLNAAVDEERGNRRRSRRNVRISETSEKRIEVQV